ncbi:hypothetical protein [Nostoc sp. 106C]|nr:hypothetical protein [Nostoc sp. 106C]
MRSHFKGVILGVCSALAELTAGIAHFSTTGDHLSNQIITHG